MTERLERDYRRLLALYPASYRDEYGEEMIGVLLADASPQQRRPSLGDVADLLRSALSARLRRSTDSVLDDRWRDAASVVGLLVPLILLAMSVRSAVTWAGLLLQLGEPVPALPDAWLIRLVGWTVTVVAVLIGARKVATGAAWLTVVAQAVASAAQHTDPPVASYANLATLMGVIGAAALSVPVASRRAVQVLGRGGTASVGLASMVIPLAGLVHFLVYQPVRAGGAVASSTIGYAIVNGITYLVAPFYLAALVALAVPLLRLDRPVLRRLMVLAVPLVTLFVLVEAVFHGIPGSYYSPPMLLASGWWLALGAIPLAAFALAVALLRRHESRLRLIELGRRHEPDAGPAAEPDPEPPTAA